MSGRYQVIGEDSDDDEQPAVGRMPARPPPGAPSVHNSGGTFPGGGQQIGAPGATVPNTTVSGVAASPSAEEQQYITVQVPVDWQHGQHLMIPTSSGNQVSY